MIHRRYMLSRLLLGLVVVAPLWMAPGCSEKGPKPRKPKTVEGVAKKIDLKSGEVSMEFTNEKGNKLPLQGIVRDDTEIIINGRQHKLEDVREGDHVKVTGFKEGDDENIKYVATRVEVRRPQESDWKSTGPGGASMSPATQPARQP